jgi:hypothetical protein
MGLTSKPIIFPYFLEDDGPRFFRLMPRETRALKLDVGRALLLFGLPAKTQEGPVDSVCFGAGPQAHKKRMAFGGSLPALYDVQGRATLAM